MAMIYRLVVPLRALILLTVLASAIAIIYGKINYPSVNSTQSYSFGDSGLLAVYIFLAFGLFLSIFGKYEYNTIFRATLAWIFVVNCVITSNNLFRRINDMGGCHNTEFAVGGNVPRCWIDYSVCIAGFAAAGLLLVEAILTYKRDTDSQYQDSISQWKIASAHIQPERSLQYQPDLSLHGGESPIATPERAAGAPVDPEEELPKYSYRKPTNEFHLVDMTHQPEHLRPVIAEEHSAGSSSSQPNPSVIVAVPGEAEPPSYKP
ncbi:hypothetical protein CPC16_009289 [Podila verticillata]|nr:hypothetical protein CPC16_009289 [Podila verticillata]KFH73136.1 hypothetical protein MVEG_00357 [Podila verticillata NRRL 6337]